MTKRQLVELLAELCDAVRIGLIENIFQDLFPYPQEKFDDPKLGPNLYQVIVHTCMGPYVAVWLCPNVHAWCANRSLPCTSTKTRRSTAQYPVPRGPS